MFMTNPSTNEPKLTFTRIPNAVPTRKQRQKQRQKAAKSSTSPTRVSTITKELVRHVQKYHGKPVTDLAESFTMKQIKTAIKLGLIRLETENEECPVFCTGKGWDLLR